METVVLSMPNFSDVMDMETAIALTQTLLIGISIKKDGKVYVPTIILKEEDKDKK